jgi:hypothetical protein
MQDFASNFQKLGGLFKLKSDLFNKNKVKTLSSEMEFPHNLSTNLFRQLYI